MSSMNRWGKQFLCGVWILLTMAVLAVGAPAQQREVSRSRVSSARHASGIDEQAEQEIFRLVNRERNSRGLQTLVMDRRLTDAAREHSNLLAIHEELTHQFPGEPPLEKRLGSVGARFDMSGENVALDDGGAESAHVSLMHSPPHRANILRPEYTAVGIGAQWRDGVLYVTEDFSRRLPETTVSDAEKAVGNSLNRYRRQSHAPLLARKDVSDLRDMACNMARQNRLSTSAAHSIPRVNRVTVFTLGDLTKMPSGVEELGSVSASAYSVGACYAASPSYTNPVYWVVLVTYF